jgi:hypothetical protein
MVFTFVLFIAIVSLLLLFIFTIKTEENDTKPQPFIDKEKGKKDTRPYCKTVDEAANWVLSQLPREETLQIAHFHEQGLIHLHFSLGMWIRNNVPVWGNEPLRKSVGENVHSDDVGGMILYKYWLLARNQLPENERKRMEYFERTLSGLKGSKPKGKTHEDVISELNSQIKDGWPKDASYPPYILAADKGTEFTWEPEEMEEDLNKNVERFLAYHRSISFYDGDTLKVGIPEEKESPNDPNREK